MRVLDKLMYLKMILSCPHFSLTAFSINSLQLLLSFAVVLHSPPTLCRSLLIQSSDPIGLPSPISLHFPGICSLCQSLISHPFPVVSNVPSRLSPEYNSVTSLHYKRLACYENLPCTGPDTQTQQANQDDESDIDDLEDDQSFEDHHTLLIKAWEQKVFPTIRRRFRNEAERKDGLEQIRGALLLGECVRVISAQTNNALHQISCA